MSKVENWLWYCVWPHQVYCKLGDNFRLHWIFYVLKGWGLSTRVNWAPTQMKALTKIKCEFSLLFPLVVFRLHWSWAKLVVRVKAGCLCGSWWVLVSWESWARWLVILMVAFIRIREGQNYWLLLRGENPHCFVRGSPPWECAQSHWLGRRGEAVPVVTGSISGLSINSFIPACFKVSL